MDKFELVAQISKVDEERRVVYGWASVIEENGKAVVDSQGDTISEAEIVRAAENFMLASREAGEMHVRTRHVGKVVASLVFTRELQKALGVDLGKVGWFIGMKIADDTVWAGVKSGKYRAFSIGGRGKRSAA